MHSLVFASTESVTGGCSCRPMLRLPGTLGRNRSATTNLIKSKRRASSLKHPFSTISSSTMPSKKKNKNKPKEGWVVELKEAEREVKKAKNQATPQHHLRVARAARKLRIWNKSKTAAEKGLSIDPHGPLRAQLVECQKQADVELSIRSAMDTDAYKSKEIADDISRNGVLVPHHIFSNLNVLQYATMTGDVRLLEDLVASGVALDYPVLDDYSSYDSDFPDADPAPKGSTALLLCCAYLAMETWLTKRGHRPKEQDEQISMMVECVILLVKLGADFHRKFILDPLSEVCGPLQSSYHRARIGGKTAQQLAQMAQLPELVKVMEELQSKEKRIGLVYCRCGSRLPWKECHAGDNMGESPVYMSTTEDEDEDEGRLAWRYSPLARCPCQHSKKKHYKCCWKQSCNPYYLDDSDGNTHQTINANVSVLCLSGITDQISFSKAIAEYNNPEKQARFLKKLCLEQEMARDGTRAHTTKHLEEGQGFKWTGLHWGLPKVELLAMVKRWNIALEKFCDEEGMTGSLRASVIAENCATPYARCGNASCTKIETKVKEFSTCSKCKTIAYCSPKCQREGWKVHKGSCRAT